MNSSAIGYVDTTTYVLKCVLCRGEWVIIKNLFSSVCFVECTNAHDGCGVKLQFDGVTEGRLSQLI